MDTSGVQRGSVEGKHQHLDQRNRWACSSVWLVSLVRQSLFRLLIVNRMAISHLFSLYMPMLYPFWVIQIFSLNQHHVQLAGKLMLDPSWSLSIMYRYALDRAHTHIPLQDLMSIHNQRTHSLMPATSLQIWYDFWPFLRVENWCEVRL